jgi:glycosyltransferase involved in cell wall biosynthesis
LKISGGQRELINLGEQFTAHGLDARLICMWSSPHPIASSLPVHSLSTWTPRARLAAVQAPFIAARFHRFAHRFANVSYVFTHYATLPLALSVPAAKRFFFVQDLEWKFVGKPLEHVLRRFILFFYRRGRIISANSYLTNALRDHGIRVDFEAPIWADRAFATEVPSPRDFDFVMVIRKGKHKRLDLYLGFIELARVLPDLRLAVISTEEELIDLVRDKVALAIVRPSLDEMRRIYARSKCFVHLSDHEGFGLPPLEAMGAGCIPVCRDSGGVRTFMHHLPQDLLLPAATPLQEIFDRALELSRDSQRLKTLCAEVRGVFERGSSRTCGAGAPLLWSPKLG